ncbi:hypothetical protein CRG98_024802 [Punica granatum]|uniref:F-box associated beta-propeller type 3 domain-containing protein n=1 Tax=Punica granatum TaxID=22663 RepID=A0A2I0JEX9_PUNGR|nr:hypothetical protein CRG98_024802 [Punica granatum]
MVASIAATTPPIRVGDHHRDGRRPRFVGGRARGNKEFPTQQLPSVVYRLSSVDRNIDLLATDCVDIAKTTFEPWLLPGCVSSSVGGLICLDYQDRAEVCNPTTKEHIILPKLPREPHLHIQRTSLCFDPIKNQQEVLRSLNYSNVDGGVVEHHIFIPGASRWRKIKDNDRRERFGEEVCVDGVLYSSSQGHNGPKLVEYFDRGIADVYCPHTLGSRNTLDSFYLAFMEVGFGDWTWTSIIQTRTRDTYEKIAKEWYSNLTTLPRLQ